MLHQLGRIRSIISALMEKTVSVVIREKVRPTSIKMASQGVSDPSLSKCK
jgi:hypothetical protein